MATTKAGPVNADRLKSFVERIERMEEERKAIGGDIRDIYAEAKGVGYDVKTVRWVVQERRMDSAARAERDALRDVYQHALDTAVDLVRGGLSLREAGRITGASKSSIHRALAVPAVSHDADGVVTETQEKADDQDVRGGRTDAAVGSGDSLGAGGIRSGLPHDASSERTAADSSERGEAEQGAAAPSSEPQRTPGATVAVGAVGPSSARVASPFMGDDPGPPPDFLRGRVA